MSCSLREAYSSRPNSGAILTAHSAKDASNPTSFSPTASDSFAMKVRILAFQRVGGEVQFIGIRMHFFFCFDEISGVAEGFRPVIVRTNLTSPEAASGALFDMGGIGNLF